MQFFGPQLHFLTQVGGNPIVWQILILNCIIRKIEQQKIDVYNEALLHWVVNISGEYIEEWKALELSVMIKYTICLFKAFEYTCHIAVYRKETYYSREILWVTPKGLIANGDSLPPSLLSQYSLSVNRKLVNLKSFNSDKGAPLIIFMQQT